MSLIKYENIYMKHVSAFTLIDVSVCLTSVNTKFIYC